MCDCIKKITDASQKHVKEMVEKRTAVYRWDNAGHFRTICFSISGGPEKISMEFEAKYVRKKKNGTPEVHATTKIVQLAPTFCPFCGEKYPAEKSMKSIPAPVPGDPDYKA